MFFNFKKPDHYDLKAYIWMFIVALNLIIMVLEEPLAELGYRGWAFWLVNISFFLMEEPNIKKKLLSICIGAIVGCLLAYGTITLYASVLMPVTGHLGLIIPVAISLALVILVGPFMPVFFNTGTFLYFVCSLIVSTDAVSNVGANICFAIAGTIIINCGCLLLISQYRKAKACKAAKSAD